MYGDTDSLFVYLPGRTREEAFDIGEDIAETITRMNPRPIKLKFEKVLSHLYTFNLSGVSSLRPSREKAVRRIQIRETHG